MTEERTEPTLPREEAIEMVENLLNLVTVEGLLDAMGQALANKAAYARRAWPDQPETWTALELHREVVISCLGQTSDLGKQLLADARAAHEALVEEIKAGRAEQDAQIEAERAEQELQAKALLTAVGPSWSFATRPFPDKPGVEVLVSSLRGPVPYADFEELQAALAAFKVFCCEEVDESAPVSSATFHIHLPPRGGPDPAEVQKKVEDLLTEGGFSQSAALQWPGAQQPTAAGTSMTQAAQQPSQSVPRAQGRSVGPGDLYFKVIEDDGIVTISLVTVDFWSKNHCFDDQHIAGKLQGAIPPDWDELMESCFEAPGHTAASLKAFALALGMLPLP